MASIDKQYFWQLAKGWAIYTGFSVFVPLLFAGALGWWLDDKYQTSPRYLLIGLGVAFIITNILNFRKMRQLGKEVDTISEKLVAKDDKQISLTKQTKPEPKI